MASCSYLRDVVGKFRCPTKSVRLLRLAVGKRVRTHVDNGLGYDFGMARIHVPIVTNPDVRFVLAGRRVELREGRAWYLDTSYPHSIANDGDADRVHLVIDCVLDEWLRGQFPADFKREMTRPELVAAYARGYFYSVVDAARRLRLEPRTFCHKHWKRLSGLGRQST